MAFDKITHYIFGLSLVCIILTIVAISAHADESPNAAQDGLITEISTKASNPAHELIRRQLSAISDRDADLAYALTTDHFHEKFDTAKEFLSHLRFELRPIYNHENVTFLEQHQTQRGLVQKVKMEDRYGEPVTVIYRLMQQDEGQWLIDSFAILALEADPI